MSNRFRCTKCGDWFTPDEFDDEEETLCQACLDQPPTRQELADEEGDRMYDEAREDGEL